MFRLFVRSMSSFPFPFRFPFWIPRLSGHCSIFALVFFVLKSLLGIARQWSGEKFAILTLKPRSHFRIKIYRTWAIRICYIRELSNLVKGNMANLLESWSEDFMSYLRLS